MPLNLVGGKLLAVLGMRGAAAGEDQLLTGCGAGNAAHHRHQLAVIRDNARDRIPVLLILENDRKDRADERRALPHVPLSLFFRFIDQIAVQDHPAGRPSHQSSRGTEAAPRTVLRHPCRSPQ